MIDLKKISQEIIRLLNNREVYRVLLFGSYAYGKSHDASFSLFADLFLTENFFLRFPKFFIISLSEKIINIFQYVCNSPECKKSIFSPDEAVFRIFFTENLCSGSYESKLTDN